MILFFGDSLAAGENSEMSFTDYLSKDMDIINAAVSGTTIGEYSIYPVDGYSLLKQIGKYKDRIPVCDTIFIEYGSNDVSAIMCGFASVQTVIVSFVKAVDWIKQLNPDARIIFLTMGSDIIIEDRSINMCQYLEDNYFAKFNFKFPISIYVETYKKLVHHIGKVCDIMYMFDDEMIREEFLSDDYIHPNKLGHKRIANNILKQFDVSRA